MLTVGGVRSMPTQSVTWVYPACLSSAQTLRSVRPSFVSRIGTSRAACSTVWAPLVVAGGVGLDAEAVDLQSHRDVAAVPVAVPGSAAA